MTRPHGPRGLGATLDAPQEAQHELQRPCRNTRHTTFSHFHTSSCGCTQPLRLQPPPRPLTETHTTEIRQNTHTTKDIHKSDTTYTAQANPNIQKLAYCPVETKPSPHTPLHTNGYNISCTHTHSNIPSHTHTSHIQPPLHSLGPPLYGYSITDVGVEQVGESPGLTPPHFQGQFQHSKRVDMPSHRKNNRKGPAKAQTHTHRAHHTHTRQTVGEGSAFTHPVDHDTHKHTEGWFNPV